VIDPRTASVVAAIAARFPGTTVEIHDNPAPDMPTMPNFICVLDVPASQTREVEDFGLEVAFAVFGDDPLPFLVGAFDPAQSAQEFRRVPLAGRVAET
jgi:hypothetical protein